MKSRLLPVVLTAALTSLGTLYLAARYQNKLPFIVQHQQLPVNYAGYNDDDNTVRAGLPQVDFQRAAEASVRAVVHVKTTTSGRTVVARDPLAEMFGMDGGYRRMYEPPQMGSGSGVVISADGYIVTNNHVVAGADQVTVTFNDRFTTTAKVIGTDPSTDIAVLKVSETNVPYMEYGNSDDVHLGQWVLAVGYPLTLDATVTAGIVSAKSRSIGINRSQSRNAIESFIQTDAAVNPGNSGGALVNASGQLIGINSAIASPTGSYAGYSYAIPANIVKKVVADLMQYGAVQRGYLGIEYLDRRSATPEQLSALGLDRSEGVYIANISPNGGASRSGLRKGDFITAINGVVVRTEPELLEQVARYKPGDNLSVTYRRDGAEGRTTVELRNLAGTTSVTKGAETGARLMGATFRILSSEEKKKYGVSSGVMVTDVGSGLLAKQTNMRRNFIITSINEKPVTSVDDVQSALASSGRMQIAGVYPESRGVYYYGLNDEGAEEMSEQ